MERSLYRFIIKYSLRQQLLILLLTAFSWPILYMTLELPKWIVNEAIGGRQGTARSLVGPDMGQIAFLMVLSFAFLFFVFGHGALKYYLNVYAGKVGEQMLRRLRYVLYAHVLRFPLPHFKKVSQGEIIPMITSEVEPVGGFIGESFSVPAFQGGMLAVYLTFIFVQDVFLGLAAVALYPLQMWLIPKMQAKVNQLSKERQITTRRLADKIGESVSGIQEVHAHDTSRYERADIGRRLGRIYEIRYEIFRRKFAIKFLNNFLAQLTPFFFYAIGGYFVISGQLSIGALVGVLAAYKDLSSPWKELLNYYQQKEDIKIKYEQVVEQFVPPGLMDEALQDSEADVLPLTGPLAAMGVTYSEDGRVKSLDGASFTLPLDRSVALVGPGGSGKEELAQLVARLIEPTGGTLQLGGQRLSQLPEAVTGRRIAYVGANAYLFATSVRDNLFYGLKHRVVKEPVPADEAARRARSRFVTEAKASGNPTDDFAADWIDARAVEAESAETLNQKALDALALVDMAEDVYQLGLRGTIDPEARPELAAAILTARDALRQRLAEEGQAELVEPFDDGRYNDNATIAENLLFGTPRDQRLDPERLADHPYVLETLAKAGLDADLYAAGRQLAETTVELFGGLGPGNELFERFSLIPFDRFPDYQALLARTARIPAASWKPDDRQRVLSLIFKLTGPRDRLKLLNDAIKAKIMDARRRFREGLPESLKGSVEFFDSAKYNGAASLQDNILFGKIAADQAQAQAKLGRIVYETLDSLGLRDDVMIAGLDFNVGIAGARLTGAQRQKLALARAILKRPDILVLHEATSNMDAASQAKVVANVLDSFKGRSVIWALQRARLAQPFDHVLVLKGGRIVEQGKFAELDRDGTALRDLLKAEAV